MAREATLRRPRGGYDAIHYPLTVPLPRARLPRAVTIHDLQHRFHPEFFTAGERAFRRIAYDRAARRADRVIAPSGFVAETLIEQLGVDAQRVHVIPHGLDHDRFRLREPEHRQRDYFLLYPANRWPHKNHERLLEAFERVQLGRPELALVLTGIGHEGKSVPDGVDVRGRVTPSELVALYRSAAAVVFPSLYEGFGSPPLEAMACGCPVAVADAGSLPEICGNAAAYFDPRSVEEMATAIEHVLDQPDELVERGLRRVREFTWERSARAHEEVYRELMANR
jgi:glycosyltransferase involved in cell wall biosynthesis